MSGRRPPTYGKFTPSSTTSVGEEFQTAEEEGYGASTQFRLEIPVAQQQQSPPTPAAFPELRGFRTGAGADGQLPSVVQRMPDGQPPSRPAVMRIGGASATSAPRTWMSSAALQTAVGQPPGMGGGSTAPMVNGYTSAISTAAMQGQSPLPQISREELQKATRFQDQVTRNMAAWRQKPEYEYLAQVKFVAGVRMETLLTLPSDLLSKVEAISAEPTPEQRSEARTDLLSYLAQIKGSRGPGFTGFGPGGGGGAGAATGGRGKRGGPKTPGTQQQQQQQQTIQQDAAIQVNLSTMPTDEQIMRVQFFNRHVNSMGLLDMLANPDVNGGANVIKSHDLIGAENVALGSLPDRLKAQGVRIEDFYYDENARREIATLVGVEFRHAAASRGTGHLHRTVDDQGGYIREKCLSIMLHCLLVDYPVRHVRYVPYGIRSSPDEWDPYAPHTMQDPRPRSIDLL